MEYGARNLAPRKRCCTPGFWNCSRLCRQVIEQSRGPVGRFRVGRQQLSQDAGRLRGCLARRDPDRSRRASEQRPVRPRRRGLACGIVRLRLTYPGRRLGLQSWHNKAGVRDGRMYGVWQPKPRYAPVVGERRPTERMIGHNSWAGANTPRTHLAAPVVRSTSQEVTPPLSRTQQSASSGSMLGSGREVAGWEELLAGLRSA